MQGFKEQTVSLKEEQYQGKNNYLVSNRTQILLVLIAIIPCVILISSTFIYLEQIHTLSNQMIDQFAKDLYSDQLESQKLQNAALVFQINSQVQKIPWQLNMLNEFLGRVLRGEVSINQNHIPAILNQDRAYNNNENTQLLALFKRNPISTSSWHHVSKDYLNQLDATESKQIQLATRMDSIWKAILYDNYNIEKYMWLKTSTVTLGHDYDGLMYLNSQNTTYSNYSAPADCPYTGPFNFDIRCRPFYQPTISNISVQVFPPSVEYGNDATYLASTFCQRRLKYATPDDPNSMSSLYSILCITLDLSTLPLFFSHFNRNSKFQTVLDPNTFAVIYDSAISASSDTILTFQDFQNNYMQNAGNDNVFYSNLKESSQYIISSSDSIKLENRIRISNTTFEYTLNGTECFVIINRISINDKIPSYETLRSVKPEKKYQRKNVYLFLDVISKDKMQKYSQNLQNKLNYFNTLFKYVSWGIAFLILCFQIYYSVAIGQQLMTPVIQLTNILQQIRFTTKRAKKLVKSCLQFNGESNKESAAANTLNEFLGMYKLDTNQDEIEVQIDEQINMDLDGVCFSSDTQILLDSFQNLFKILQFTSQNIYKENVSISLLNFSIQIKHFEQFGNYAALGICHNNIGVIHHNCGRYEEALDHFEKAVVYAKYELEIYAHEVEEMKKLMENIKIFQEKFKNFLFNESDQNSESNNIFLDFLKEFENVRNYDNLQFENSISMFHNQINKETVNENQHLFWNLYNRQKNYLKSMGLYLKEHKENLWDLYQEVALQCSSISQLYLPPSAKREMLNYYTISIAFQKQSLTESSCQIMQKLNVLFAHKYQAKNKKFTETRLSPSFAPLADDQSKSILLISPILRDSKKQSLPAINLTNSFHTPKLQQNHAWNNQHINQNKENLHQSIFQCYDNQISPLKRSNTRGILKSNRRESLLLQAIKNNRKSSLKNGIDFVKIDIDQNLEKKRSLTTFKLNPEEQTSPMAKINLIQKACQILNFSPKVISYENGGNTKNNSISFSPIIESQTHIFSNNSLVRLESSPVTMKSNAMKFKLIEQKTYSNYQQNQTSKSPKKSVTEVIHTLHNERRSQSKTAASENEYTFYRVKKPYNTKKSNLYEYSSDIYFEIFSIQQSMMEIKKKNFLNAAEILTKQFEQCKYYLPHYKMKAYRSLSSIFKSESIVSNEFQQMKRKYSQLSNCSIQVCTIAACKKFTSQKKLFALSHDLINEVLFKETDSFGLLQYSFEDHLYEQLMKFTSIKQIHSNQIIFQSIFLSMFQLQQNNNNNNSDVSKKTKVKYSKKVKKDLQQADIKALQQSITPFQQNDSKMMKLNSLDKQNKEIQRNIPIQFQDNYQFNQTEDHLKSSHSQSQKPSSQSNQSSSNESSFSSTSSSTTSQSSKSHHTTTNISQVTFEKEMLCSEPLELSSPGIGKIPTMNIQSYKNEEDLLNQQISEVKKCINLTVDTPLLRKQNRLQMIQSKQEQQQNNNQKEKNLQTSTSKYFRKQQRKGYQKFNGEEAFHNGIHAALNSYILNTNQKISIYLALQEFKQNNSEFKRGKKQNFTYLIYFTDQPLQFNNQSLLNSLSDLLFNLETELLVLLINKKQTLEEFSTLQNTTKDRKPVISFFNSEERLLQYIYNYREHLRNDVLPMQLEHF